MRRALFSLLAGAVACVGMPPPISASLAPPERKVRRSSLMVRRPSRYSPHQGLRKCARRRRRMAAAS